MRIEGIEFRELRCRQCRAFITYEKIAAGHVFHQCPKCGFKNVFEFRFINTPGMIEKIVLKYTIKSKRGGE